MAADRRIVVSPFFCPSLGAHWTSVYESKILKMRISESSMPESKHGAATQAESIDLATAMPCPDRTRRTLILTALATGACLATAIAAAADEDQPGSDERPQKADLLVFSEGEHAGEVIKPEDLKLGGPPVHAWPKDPKTSVIRKGSRLNEILVVKT